MPSGPAPTQLAADAVASFHRDGFVVAGRLVGDTQLARLRVAVDRIADGTHPDRAALQVWRREGEGPYAQVHAVGMWRADPAIRELALASPLATIAAQLIGHPRPRLYRDQLFVKPPASSGIVPWHQDYSDWTHTEPAAYVTGWLALDRAGRDSGCLRYLPGSHGGALLPKIGPDVSMQQAWDRLPAALAATAPVPAPVEAGEATFHHCLTVHASAGNTSPAPRRAVAVTYMHPDTRSSAGDRPAVPGGPRVPAGEPLTGPLFPPAEV